MPHKAFALCASLWALFPDAGGNFGNAIVAATAYNTGLPQVTVNAEVQNGEIVVTWDASDPGGVHSCILSVQNPDGSWSNLDSGASGTYNYVNGIPGHLHTFRVSATDTVGNPANAEVEIGLPRVTKYYYHGGKRVAMRVDEQGGDGVYYLHGDHLGSTSLTTDESGGMVARQLYHPYGTTRYSEGTLATDFGFTGQRHDGTGLVFMHARYYHPMLGRFISADTMVPSPGNPQDFNRYTYTRNNPVLYTDPSGHFINLAFALAGAVSGAVIGAVASAGPQMIQNIQNGEPLMTNIDTAEVAKDAAIGAAVGAVGGLTFGVGLAAGGAIAGAIGVSSASGVAATAIGFTTVALSGAAAGQTSRVTSNVLYGRDVTEGLLQPEDMLLDATLSVVFFKAGGGNFNQIAPSDITRTGAYARESVVSSRPDRVTGSESKRIQLLGDRYGCHTCGVRQPGGRYGTWVGDHMPPTSQAGGASQQLYPQCAFCSAQQGGLLSHGTTRLVNHIWEGAWRLYYGWGPLWMLGDHGDSETE